MATHSSTLAWGIPGTGEPAGLPSMGSHKVRHNWSDLAAATNVSLLASCSASLAAQHPNNSKTQGRDYPSEFSSLCYEKLCAEGWFCLWLSFYGWHISFWCLSRTPMRFSPATPMSAVSAHWIHLVASPNSPSWYSSQCCTVSLLPSASYLFTCKLQAGVSGILPGSLAIISCDTELFSGALVASWPFLASIDLISYKRKLACVSKNV